MGFESGNNRDPLRRPVALCEYAHAMGNSAGGLEDYWALFWDRKDQKRRVQGGFIWEYMDQGLALRPCDTRDPHLDDDGDVIFPQRFGYGGNFGDVPNTSCFCITGMLAPDRQPHPIALEAWAVQAPVLATFTPPSPSLVPSPGTSAMPLPLLLEAVLAGTSVRVLNRFDFVTLAQVDVSLSLVGSSAAPGARTDIRATRTLQRDALDGTLAGSALEVCLCDVFSSEDCHSVLGDGGDCRGCVHVEAAVTWRSGASAAGLSEGPLGFTNPLGLPLAVSVASADLTALLEALRVMLSGGEDGHGHGDGGILELPLRAVHRVTSTEGSGVLVSGFGSRVLGAHAGSPATSSACVGICGRLVALAATEGGVNVLRDPVDVCLARAPTNNDLGGMALSYGSRWESVGLTSLGGLVRWGRPTVSIVGGASNGQGQGEDEGEDVTVVTAVWTLVPLTHAEAARAAALQHSGAPADAAAPAHTPVAKHNRWRPSTRMPLAKGGAAAAAMEFMDESLPPSYVTRVPIPVTVTYTFGRAGVTVSYAVRVPATLPPLPRVGLHLHVSAPVAAPCASDGAVAADSDALGGARVMWRGQGPYESYPDRTALNRFGVFDVNASVLATESLGYVVPQECGSRASAEALRVECWQGSLCITGLRTVTHAVPRAADTSSHKPVIAAVAAVAAFHWSVLPVSLDTLARASHRHQLRFRGTGSGNGTTAATGGAGTGVDPTLSLESGSTSSLGSEDSACNLLGETSLKDKTPLASARDGASASKSASASVSVSASALARASLFVHVDSEMSGVGGYDSWSPNIRHDYLVISGSIYTGGATFSLAPGLGPQ